MEASGVPAEFSDPQPNHQRPELRNPGVEGAQYSGSAITARLAIDQGREFSPFPETSPRR